jgi:tRNA (guanine-N7-)-methyltransferase
MPKNKLQRYAEIGTFENVVECPGDPDRAGELREKLKSIFRSAQPLVLELACGKAEYTLAMARAHRDRNFLGVDIKGARLWKGAKAARGESLGNAGFLRCYIQFLPLLLEPGSVSEMWITFPDPRPGKGDANKRLTSPFFLELYKKFLAPGAPIHLKTDSAALFEFSLESAAFAGYVVEEVVDDVPLMTGGDPRASIQTYFEKKHRDAGRAIRYLRLRAPAAGEERRDVSEQRNARFEPREGADAQNK